MVTIGLVGFQRVLLIASDKDEWGDNNVIGGEWCNPANGWLLLNGDDPDCTSDPSLYSNYALNQLY